MHQKGKTIIFVTNAIDYTEECDRVIVLSNGKIVEDGPPQKLLSQAKSVYGELKLQYKISKSKEE